jgi:uncharacterized damage-inducible protein DinB
VTASDPTLEAARSIVGESLDAMRAAIAGASADALNRRPAGEDTNPIAVLVVHALSSTRWWLSVALGEPVPERDRPSEFLTTVTGADELLGVFDPIAADCRALLSADVALDPGAIREDPRDGDRVTAAWALIHAVEHLREHVGHAELTRQLFDRPG